MKIRRRLQSIFCVFAIILCIGGFTIIAKAGTSYLDVTVSNVPGATSEDPYSFREVKDDSEQRFYITLTSLQGGPYISFTAYNDADQPVSSYAALTVHSTELNNTINADYSVTAYAGKKYYVHATAPLYYANVHAVGRYCP